MKSLILEYKEYPDAVIDVIPNIKYDEDMSLSINCQTGRPSIEDINMATETFTKSNGESSDSDAHRLPMMGMKTFTKSDDE